jgi:hypothetical protein
MATNKLLRLLRPENPLEVRCAAALLLGELGERDADTVKALCDSLEDGEPALRLQAIRAVGKLRVEQALPQLLARIKDGGEEAEQAAQAAARLGARGAKALQELMPRVAPGLRRYIAAALAGGGTASANAAALAVLLDHDPAIVEATVQSLVAQAPSLTPSQREAWTDQLLNLAADKKEPLTSATQAAVVRLLAVLDDPRAGDALWERTAPPYPAEVRAAALQALGKWAGAPGKDQLKRLFACARETDFRVVAPALVLLRRLPVADKTALEWTALLRAPDVAARRLALEKVGDRDQKEVAVALAEQLSHPDRGLPDEALARLTRMEHGRKVLTAALLEAPTADQAWRLAKAQAPFVVGYPAAWRGEVVDRAANYLEAGDRRADPLFFLLREADARDLRDRLEQRALAHRKKKDYATALLYLRLLARDPACGLPTRLELAACGLKVSAKDLATDARAADPPLQQFVSLAQQSDTDLCTHLAGLKWLGPDDLYYLGFHLAEQGGRPRKLGGEVLRLVAKRAGRTKQGQAAKSKLRSAGLD